MQFISASIVKDQFFKMPALPPLESVGQAFREFTVSQPCYFSYFVQDPGLALQLLRTVKAGEELALHTLYQKAGDTQIMEIVEWAKASAYLPINLPGPDYYLFWRTSLHRSVLVRELARLAGLVSSAEKLATTALLQEAALPMLLLCLNRDQTLSFPGFHVSLPKIISWSRSFFNLDHRELGRKLFERWGLPIFLRQSQAISVSNKDNPDFLLLELARQGVESFYAEDVELTQMHENAVLWFGIDPEQLNESIANSLEMLSRFSLNKNVYEDLDGNWSSF